MNMKAFVVSVLLSILSACAYAAPPPCLPSSVGLVPIGGSGTAAVTGKTDEGVYYAYRCQDGKVVFRAILSTWTGPNASDLLSEAFGYPSWDAAAAVMWDRMDVGSNDPKWQILWTKARNAGFAIPDPSAGFAVKKSGTSANAPTYRVGTNNVIPIYYTTTSIPAGSPCDCVKFTSTIGAKQYCSVSTGYVAVCEKK
jgi:hypothetical protein